MSLEKTTMSHSLPQPRAHALIVAAGSGSRMGAARPKQYLELGGRSILHKTIQAFLHHPRIASVRVVINPKHRDMYDEALHGLALPEPVAGGAARQDSVLAGLEVLAREVASDDYVLIHDAARPFIAASTISETIAALDIHDGAIVARPVTDTMKRADDKGVIQATIERTALWRAETPQAFRLGQILAAHRKAAGQGLTDDAAVAQAAGLEVVLVPSEGDNFKITRDADLVRARLIAEQGKNMDHEYRTGFGFDVHELIPGDGVTLCGVKIAHDRKLKGHSDADVGLHALTDALLGTIGAGDIGEHFPPSDPRWKGADSMVFLTHAAKLIKDAGGRIVNVDITILAEKPKVGPHRDAMRAKIGAVLGLAPDRIGIKATTTETLGFTGREEGIAAQAVTSVAFPCARQGHGADAAA